MNIGCTALPNSGRYRIILQLARHKWMRSVSEGTAVLQKKKVKELADAQSTFQLLFPKRRYRYPARFCPDVPYDCSIALSNTKKNEREYFFYCLYMRDGGKKRALQFTDGYWGQV